MNTPTTYADRDSELAVPAHLARYAAEVETWRLEALAYRAAQAEKAHR
jgi:hypothetical protein